MIARSERLSAGVVEKDYALTWLLKGIYRRGSELRNNLVLKGGTAIRKAYHPKTWRFSEDLDFTVIGVRQPAEIRQSIQSAFERLLTASGIRYSIEAFHPTPGSIIANVQYLGPLNFTNRIKHDISLKEKMALKPEWRSIKKIDFPDIAEFKILAYSLTEILVEKIRSIMQRGYSRDYYDVWRLFQENKFKESDIQRYLVQKCELNGISYKPRMLFDRERLRQARSFWVKGLSYLTKELPEFESVVSDLSSNLSFLN